MRGLPRCAPHTWRIAHPCHHHNTHPHTLTHRHLTTSPSLFPTLSPTALSYLSTLSQLILSGDRSALSRGITLLESTRPEHQQQGNHLLHLLSLTPPSPPITPPPTSPSSPSSSPPPRRNLRIGISGPPGVGKSTFIEQFGQLIVDGAIQPHRSSNAAFSSEASDLADTPTTPSPSLSPSSSPPAALPHTLNPSPPSSHPHPHAPSATGNRLAIFTIDPSSHLTGGSILGDRTRMPLLSAHPSVYIRPSPSKLSLGGVHPSTYASLTLSTSAHYNLTLIETVGVGQSEVAVRHLTDCLILLVPPSGGDELQGMKKGVIELADLVVVNKADGAMLPAARHTFSDYRRAVQLMGGRMGMGGEGGWVPEVMMVSSMEEGGKGVRRVWERVQAFDDWLGEDRKRQRRGEAERRVMLESVPQVMWGLLMASERGRQVVQRVEERVASGEINVRVGAQQVVEELMQRFIHDHTPHPPPTSGPAIFPPLT